jgi:hypothetical protein
MMATRRMRHIGVCIPVHKIHGCLASPYAFHLPSWPGLCAGGIGCVLAASGRVSRRAAAITSHIACKNVMVLQANSVQRE